MAKATTAMKRIITLDLQETEADYLQDILQNYLGDGFESVEEYDIRRELFETIKRARAAKT